MAQVTRAMTREQLGDRWAGYKFCTSTSGTTTMWTDAQTTVHSWVVSSDTSCDREVRWATATGTTSSPQSVTYRIENNPQPVYTMGRSEPIMYTAGPRTASYEIDTGTTTQSVTWESVTPIGDNEPHWVRMGEWNVIPNYTPGPDAKKLKKANAKADRLLKSWLSDAEYNYLMEDGKLEIPSRVEDDVIYIIKKDPHAKVRKMKKGKPESDMCLSVGGGVPGGDILLSKILLIKNDEEHFIRTANKWAVSKWEEGEVRITQHELNEIGMAVPKAFKAIEEGISKLGEATIRVTAKASQTITPGQIVTP